MPKFGMVIDLEKCTACQACVVACAVENNLPSGNINDAQMNRIIRWLKILPISDAKSGIFKMTLIPFTCQQCSRPPCTYVCPVSATYKNPDGIIAQVYWRCIGCRYCVNACPYTIKFFNWYEPENPYKENANPDVFMREKGVTEKCLFCHHRLQRAKEAAKYENREIGSDEYQPACVEACPARAIVFGDMEDVQSKVVELSHSTRAFRFLEELGTSPNITYLKEVK